MADRKWWTLTVVALATFMLLLDITIVNVALPAIQSSHSATFSDVQWVVDAYALTLAVTLLCVGVRCRPSGPAGGVRRRAGGVLCGVTALRAGPRPADAHPLTCGPGPRRGHDVRHDARVVAQVFHGPERATAFGILGAVTGAAVAVGPSGRGPDRWFRLAVIFLVNVPIGVIAIALTMRNVRETKDPSPHGIDWWGAAAFSGSLFLLALGLIRGNADGWLSAADSLGPASSAGLCSSCSGWSSSAAGPRCSTCRSSASRRSAGCRRRRSSCRRRCSRCSSTSRSSCRTSSVTARWTRAWPCFPSRCWRSSCPRSPEGCRRGCRPASSSAWACSSWRSVSSSMAHVRADSTWTVLLAGFVVAGIGIGMINPLLSSPRSASSARRRAAWRRESARRSVRSESRPESPGSAPSSKLASSPGSRRACRPRPCGPTPPRSRPASHKEEACPRRRYPRVAAPPGTRRFDCQERFLHRLERTVRRGFRTCALRRGVRGVDDPPEGLREPGTPSRVQLRCLSRRRRRRRRDAGCVSRPAGLSDAQSARPEVSAATGAARIRNTFGRSRRSPSSTATSSAAAPTVVHARPIWSAMGPWRSEPIG